MSTIETEVAIIGAGIAGLTCAKELKKAGKPFKLIDKSDRPGGRMKTDQIKGFRLDRGFQVMLDAYPECKAQLDYVKLDLKKFVPGSLIQVDGKFEKIVDPANQPLDAFASLFSPIGSLTDKFKLANLRMRIKSESLEDIYRKENEMSTYDFLKDQGFSDKIIERLFTPFLGGIYLNPDLSTTDKFLHFVFKMFAQGDTVVPAKGIEEIPRQLAKLIPDDQMMFNTGVNKVEGKKVILENGEEIIADQIVIATEGNTAKKLLNVELNDKANSVLNIYFSADKAPFKDKMLVLNGNSKNENSHVNNVSCMSNIAPDYAPEGKHLISVSVIKDESIENPEIESLVQKELQSWFGSQVRDWEHLKTYKINYALPVQKAGDMFPKIPDLPANIHVCGDHTQTASINGAMASGRIVAEEILSLN